jgi:putative sterol carrier protein
MTRELFTLEWALAWRDEILANPTLKAVAGNWVWPLVLIMKADPELGLECDRSVYLDLYQGVCRAARLATPDDLEQAPYLLSADPRTWKQVLDRRLEPLVGVMRGKLRLVKGSVAVVLPHVRAAMELVEAAIRVETSYPARLESRTAD